MARSVRTGVMLGSGAACAAKGNHLLQILALRVSGALDEGHSSSLRGTRTIASRIQLTYGTQVHWQTH